jgi:hypothetical protein
VERAEPELERTARRARRVIWAFRVVFYPGAALAAVLLFASRGDGEPARWLTGKTDQGRPIGLAVRDGRPTFLNTFIVGDCPWEERWALDWSRGPGAPVPWRFEDGTLTIRQRTDHRYERDWTGERSLTMKANVDDDEASGQMSLVEELRDPTTGRYYVCHSGPVRFTVRRER